MQLTQVIAFLAIAIVGAVAAPGGHQPPPPPPPPAKPTSVVQQVFYGCHLVTCYAVLIPHLDFLQRRFKPVLLLSKPGRRNYLLGSRWFIYQLQWHNNLLQQQRRCK
jgi:hypothetical protein